MEFVSTQNQLVPGQSFKLASGGNIPLIPQGKVTTSKKYWCNLGMCEKQLLKTYKCSLTVHGVFDI
jgi:hypothetical protein